MMTFSPGPSGEGQPDRWEEPLLPHELDARFSVLRAQVSALRARGGRVVLYRPPVTDDVLADEERRFPAKTWLPRVASALGVPYIDFSAVAGLQAVACPDGEHLDARGVPAATDALARALRDLL
jgi:lysophospholipase L1-like esterase